MTAFQLLIFIYIWPIKISPNPENPAPWYYIVSPEWWTGKMGPERDFDAEPDFEFDEQTEENYLLGNDTIEPQSPMFETKGLLQAEELDLVR